MCCKNSRQRFFNSGVKICWRAEARASALLRARMRAEDNREGATSAKNRREED